MVVLVEVVPGGLAARLGGKGVQAPAGRVGVAAAAQQPDDERQLAAGKDGQVAAAELIIEVAEMIEPLPDVALEILADLTRPGSRQRQAGDASADRQRVASAAIAAPDAAMNVRLSTPPPLVSPASTASVPGSSHGTGVPASPARASADAYSPPVASTRS
jgi:hypothetical protein